MKKYTLVFVLKENTVCLGMKKRGFGEGYWNGFGGKLEDRETIPMGAIREVYEESGISLKENDLENVAVNQFYFEDGKHLEVHVFFAHVGEVDPVETEEMKPQWFDPRTIPYESMWEDDMHWLPRVLGGEKLRGKVWFHADGKSIKDMEWITVEDF